MSDCPFFISVTNFIILFKTGKPGVDPNAVISILLKSTELHKIQQTNEKHKRVAIHRVTRNPKNHKSVTFNNNPQKTTKPKGYTYMHLNA